MCACIWCKCALISEAEKKRKIFHSFCSFHPPAVCFLLLLCITASLSIVFSSIILLLTELPAKWLSLNGPLSMERWLAYHQGLLSVQTSHRHTKTHNTAEDLCKAGNLHTPIHTYSGLFCTHTHLRQQTPPHLSALKHSSSLFLPSATTTAPISSSLSLQVLPCLPTGEIHLDWNAVLPTYVSSNQFKPPGYLSWHQTHSGLAQRAAFRMAQLSSHVKSELV